MQQNKKLIFLLTALAYCLGTVHAAAENTEQPTRLHVNISGIKPIIKQLQQKKSHRTRAFTTLARKKSDEVKINLLLRSLPEITGYALELTESENQNDWQLGIDSLQHLARIQNASQYFTKTKYRNAQLNQLSEKIEATLAQLPEYTAQSITRAAAYEPGSQGTRELIVNKVIPCLGVSIDNEITIESKIDAITFEVNTVFSKICTIDSKIDVIDNEISIIDNTTISISSKIDVINNDSGTVLSKVCQLDSKIDVIDNENESIFSKVCIIESKLDQIECSTILSKICTIDSKIDVINNNITNIDQDFNETWTILHAIQNKSCTIDSKVDVIDEEGETSLSKVCVIESKLDNLSDDLFSLIDEVNTNITKTCSGSTTCTTSSNAFTSVFGSQIAEGREDYISIQYQYGISDFDISTSLVGTGTTSTIESSAVVGTMGGAGDVSQIESKRNLRYRPGHEGYAFFTAAFTGDTAADTTQWIGLFDDEDGYAIGYNGTTFSILHRRDGTDTFVAQSAFNVDPLDGTGPSGFTYDPTKLNVFRISYGWLGAAPITFRVLTTEGDWIIFHVIERPGTEVGPSVLNPVLPLRAQVIDTAGGNSLELRSASWNAGIVGSPSTAAHRYFSASNNMVVSAGDSETAMVSIRNKSTFESKPNKIEVRIAEFGGGAIANAEHVTIVRMRKDSTLTGASFSDVSTGKSVMEVDTSATAFSGGDLILIQPVHARGNGPGMNFIPGGEFEVIALPGETITITVENLQGNTSTIAHLAWEERF